MNASQVFATAAVAILLLIVIFLLFVKKDKKEVFSPLAGLAFAFMLFGLIFGENRFVGYSLLGIGVILAIIDILKKSKNK